MAGSSESDKQEVLPASENEQPEAWPIEYWPETASPHKVMDRDLRSIIHDIAYTNESVSSICRRHDVSEAHFYRLRNELPRLSEAFVLARAVRDERLEDEMLEIADAPLDHADPKDNQVELAHRRLRMEARNKLRKRSEKQMERLTINVGSKSEDGQSVTLVQVNYGDRK